MVNKQKESINNLLSVWNIFENDKLSIIFYGVLKTLYAVMYIAFAFSLSQIISAIEKGNKSQTLKWLMILLFVRLINLFVTYFCEVKKKVVNSTCLSTLKNLFIDSVLNMRTEKIDNYLHGDLLTRFSDDLKGIVYFLDNVILNAISTFVIIICIIFYTGLLDWKINIIAIIMFPIIFLASIREGKKIEAASNNLQEEKSNLNVSIKDILDRRAEIVSYDASDYFISYLEERIDTTLNNEIKAYNRERVMWVIEMVGYDIFSIGYFILSSIVVFVEGAGVGYIAGLMLLNGYLVEQFFNLPNLYTEYKTSKAKINRYLKIVKDHVEIECENKVKIDDSVPIVEFKNVSFGYSEDTLLKNINLSIKRGSKVAIIGESASGKSTLLKLICGYSKRYAGSIKIIGCECKNMGNGFFRNNVSYFPQYFDLFSMSIKENLMLFSDNEEEKYDEYAEQSAIIADINSMSNKYETKLEDDIELSSGQKQRLGWMINFMKYSDICLIDEGFSNLDFNNIKHIFENIMSKKNQTLIMVSHVLNEEILSRFDQIIILDKGEIKMVGSHESLKKNENYFKFYRECKEGIN
jgi:ABC-type bacteriocin/lantibiotic exporter with double-glycine peptidase domain